MHSQPFERKWVPFRKPPNTHQSGGNRDLAALGKLQKIRGGIRGNNTTAGVNHRTLSRLNETDHFLDGDQRNRIHVSVGNTSHEVGRPGAGGRHTDASASGCSSIASSGKHATLLMARKNGADLG